MNYERWSEVSLVIYFLSNSAKGFLIKIWCSFITPLKKVIYLVPKLTHFEFVIISGWLCLKFGVLKKTLCVTTTWCTGLPRHTSHAVEHAQFSLRVNDKLIIKKYKNNLICSSTTKTLFINCCQIERNQMFDIQTIILPLKKKHHNKGNCRNEQETKQQTNQPFLLVWVFFFRNNNCIRFNDIL